MYLNGQLFQWEKNRRVFLSEEEQQVTFIEFYNKNSCFGPEVEVQNGYAEIPNFLLKNNLPITAVGCLKQNEQIIVVSKKTFTVIPRVRPESYIDEGDPINPNVPGPDIIYDGGVEE